MKKFAAIFISLMLVAMMAISPAFSAAANPDFATAAGARNYKGTLTLTKYEPVPNQTTPATDAQKKVPGATFTAYRVYNLNNDGTFELNANFKSDIAVDGTTLGAKLAGYVNGDKTLAYNSTKELEDLKPYLQQAAAWVTGGDVFTSTEAKNAEGKGTGVYSFNLDLGIYLVVETGIPANYAVASVPFLVSVPQWDEDKNGEGGKWNFDIKANPKDDKVTLDKVITNSDDVKPVVDVKSATKDIGDKVEYKITMDVPWYGGKDSLTQAQKDDIIYTFVDVMSEGLTFDKDSFTAKVNGNEVPAKLDVKTDDKGKTTITAIFNWNDLNDNYQGCDMIITYFATINEKAKAGVANENAAKLQYTEDPRKNNKFGPPTGYPEEENPEDPDNPKKDPPKETPESETVVYTYEMDLTKTFNGAAPTSDVDATQVQFTLSVLNVDKETNEETKTPVYFIETDKPGVYVVYGDNFGTDDGNIAAPAGKKVDRISPDATGKLVVRGLDDVTYVLSEVSSVDGWSKLASDVEIALVGGKSGDPEEFDGTLASAKATPGGDLVINKATVSATNGVFDISINNVKKQFDLPLTGGAGLLMFTIGGGIVIAGAIIIFSTLRKKRVAE